jgi:hypothetical protein
MLTATPSERRTTGAFALFEYGYRPFFLLAALHGAVLVPVWVAAVFGWLALPVEMEVSWHAHQMVYGFAAAGAHRGLHGDRPPEAETGCTRRAAEQRRMARGNYVVFRDAKRDGRAPVGGVVWRGHPVGENSCPRAIANRIRAAAHFPLLEKRPPPGASGRSRS